MFCVACGEVIGVMDEVCQKCGTRPMFKTRRKYKMTAILLAILLGTFGMQHFYLERPIAGLFSMLFCWTLIPMVIGLVHGMMMLMSSQADFDEKYNNGE